MGNLGSAQDDSTLIGTF